MVVEPMRMFAMLMIVLAGLGASASGQTGKASVTLTTTPSPLGLGQNRFDVTVVDAAGRPVANADVTLSLVMPADPKTKHPEMRTEGKLNNAGGGKYNGVAMVTMAGAWHVTVTAVQKGKAIAQLKTILQAHAVRPKTPRRQPS
jgi:nitrogen fixation protein FixH